MQMDELVVVSKGATKKSKTHQNPLKSEIFLICLLKKHICIILKMLLPESRATSSRLSEERNLLAKESKLKLKVFQKQVQLQKLFSFKELIFLKKAANYLFLV